MKFIIHSLDARNKAKPYYRECRRIWRVEEYAVDLFFVAEPEKATRFDDEDYASRFAIEILLLDHFSIDQVMA